MEEGMVAGQSMGSVGGRLAGESCTPVQAGVVDSVVYGGCYLVDFELSPLSSACSGKVLDLSPRSDDGGAFLRRVLS